MRKNIWVIIVAAGAGTRFRAKVPKPFVLLKGKTLLSYSLKVFEQSPLVNSVIVVGHKDYLPRFQQAVKPFRKVSVVVAGGATRADSVKRGLSALDQDADIVMVHDAARPFVDQAMIGRLVVALQEHKAAIVAVPVKATIKKVNAKTMIVEETPKRDLLWDVQTPQGFHKNTLLKAHAKIKPGTSTGFLTDDAMLVEAMGIKVKVVMGDYRNIKITTPEDLIMARGL